MAQPMFQPVLSGVQGSTYINPGVQDNSMASLISGLGTQAVEAYKGYNIAEYEKAQEETMKSFMETPTEDQMIGMGRDIQDTSKILEDQWASPYATWEGVDVAEKNLTDSTNKLINAAKQGIFSPQELNTRMLANLRDAVNRNPGLERELIDQTRKIMKYSGMTDYLSTLEDRQKAADEQIKQQWQQDRHVMDFTGIFFNSNSSSLEDRIKKEASYNRYSKIKQNDYENLTVEHAEKQGRLGELKIQEYLKNPTAWGQKTTTEYDMLDNKILSWVAANPQESLDPAKRQLGIQAILQPFMARYAAIRTQAGDAAPQVTEFMDQLSARAKTYIDIGTGEIAAKHLQNMGTIAKVKASLPFVNMEQQLAMDQKIATILMSVPNTDTIALTEVLRKHMGDIANWYTNQSPISNPIATANPRTPAGKTAISFTTALTDNVGVNDKTIGLFMDLDRQAKEDPNPTAKSNYAMMVNQVASDWVKYAASKDTTLGQLVGPENNQKMQEWITDKMGAFSNYVIDYDEGNKRFLAKDKDGKVMDMPTASLNNLINASKSLAGYKEMDQKAGAAVGAAIAPGGAQPYSPPFTFSYTGQLTREKLMEGVNKGQLTIEQADYLARQEGVQFTYGTTEAKAKPPVGNAGREPLSKSFTPVNEVEQAKKMLVEIDGKLSGMGNFFRMGSKERKELEDKKEMLQLYLAKASRGEIDPEFAAKVKEAKEMLQRFEPAPQSYEELQRILKEREERDKGKGAASKPNGATGTWEPTQHGASSTWDTKAPQKETKEAAALRNFLGYPPPKGVIPLVPEINASKVLKEDRAKADAIESVSVLDAFTDAVEGVNPAAAYAVGAAMLALGMPSGSKYFTKKLLDKGMDMTTQAGRVAVKGSNVMPLNEGASKAVVAAMKGQQKAKAEALFKEYWTSRWQKERVELPKTDLEWSNAIKEANDYVAERLKPTPLKSMGK